MTLGEALAEARAQGLATMDAHLLLTAVTGHNRARHIAFPETGMDSAQQARWAALLQRRCRDEPLAYLLGEQGFMDMQLAVSPAVLIPRPETELLVELALGLPLPEHSRVLDPGTGSGAIILALARARPGWYLLASDLSREALTVAAANQRHWAPGRVQLFRGHWLEAVGAASLDLVVSNPPYVADEDPELATDVAAHEPATALFAGADGLTAIRLIAPAAIRTLKPGGWLLLEHGARQGPAVRQLLEEAGFEAVRTCSDHAGHDRVTLGQRSRKPTG